MSDEKLARSKKKTQARFYIGGSDIAALLNVDPNRTPRDVYNEKLQLVEQEPENYHMKRGKLFEPIAAQQYMEKTGRKVKHTPQTLVHPEYDFLRGHTDYEHADNGEPLEIKCPGVARFSYYKLHGLPENLIAQMLWYLGLLIENAKAKHVTPVESGVWSLFNSELVSTVPFPIQAEPYRETITVMFQVAVTFWQENIEKRIPPPEGKPDKQLVEFEKIPGELTVVDSTEYAEAMELLHEAKKFIEQGKDLESLAKDRVKDAVGRKFGKYTGPGGKVYWHQQQGRKTFDAAKLASAAPVDREKLTDAIREHFGKGPFQKMISLLDDCGLDLNEFYKQGEPFEMLRTYFPKEREG